ncbi:MAG: MOSC domain-containing protein [Pseudomonadota bacterium]
MAILQPTNITGRVEGLFLVADSEVSIASEPVERVAAQFEGFRGDCHTSLTRKACVRTKKQYAEGTEIRNVRQVTIVSVEELQAIADAMGLPGVKPEWLGATMCVSGIPDFTLVPPSSRLIFGDGTGLVVDMENEPCAWPGKQIEKHHPGFGRLFVPNARNRRGITAWVEREGTIAVGDSVSLHVPPQRIYQPAIAREAARVA